MIACRDLLCGFFPHLLTSIDFRSFSIHYNYLNSGLPALLLPPGFPRNNYCTILSILQAGRSGDRIPVGRDFPPVQTGPGAHPASCTMGTGSFPGVKYGRGVLLTTHPLLVPRSWKSRAIPLPTLWATPGPVMGTLYLSFLPFYH